MQLDSPDNKKFGFPMRLDVDNKKEKVSKVIDFLGYFIMINNFLHQQGRKSKEQNIEQGPKVLTLWPLASLALNSLKFVFAFALVNKAI